MLSSIMPILNCTVRHEPSLNSLNIHPLCVEEVLGVLFKYFTFSELKKFRMVCRTWEQEARHRILTENTKWELAPIALAKDKDITKFLNVVGKQSPFFDFNVIYLVNFVYDPKKTVKTSKFLRLFHVHGQHIKSLHLRNFSIKGNLRHFVAFLSDLQRFCPNLEKLHLTSPIFKGTFENEKLSPSEKPLLQSFEVKSFGNLLSLIITHPNQFKDDNSLIFDNYMRQIFNVTPNLEEFTFYDRTGGCKCPLNSLLDCVQRDSLKKLNSIHLDTHRGDLHELKQLEALGKLKLKYLKFGFDTYGLNPELAQLEFTKLLKNQQDTLANLQICFNVCDISHWHSFLKPPTLPFIQELNIPYKIFSFSILKCMRNLKKLILRGNSKSSCWIEETDNYTFPENDMLTGLNTSLSRSLESWGIESGNYMFQNPLHLRCEFVIDEPTLLFFAKKFSKIHVLEFGYLSEEVLLQVYVLFPGLKHLSIVCPPSLYVSSKAYLGESKTIALTESKLTGFKLDVETRNKVAEKIRTSSNPSILCLKGLERLELVRFGSLTSINRIHHSIECSSGFMFGISALPNVTELKLHPFVHKRAVMSLRLMSSLKTIWAVPLIIGNRETGGRSDYPTTAYWYQVLLRKRPDLKIFVTTAPTSREREYGVVGTATRLLQVSDVYRGNATSSGLFVYLDEYYMYQDGCEVPKPERIESSTPSCTVC